MHPDEEAQHPKVDAPITVRPASRGDADTVAAITDAAYSKYIPRIGRKPEPMTVDYGDMISENPVHTLMVGDRPAGVLVLKHEGDQTLIWSVAVHPDHQGRGLGLRLLRLAEQEARARSYLAKMKDKLPRVAFFCTMDGKPGDAFKVMEGLAGKSPLATAEITSGDVKKGTYKEKAKTFTEKLAKKKSRKRLR